MRIAILAGTVLKVTAQYVVVDIGYKSEGVVPVAEFKDHEGNVSVQPGDEIAVMREPGHTEEGYIHLSHQKAQRLQGLGRDREGLQRQGLGQGARHRPHQGRPDRRHSRRPRVPARLAGRSAPGAQPRRA